MTDDDVQREIEANHQRARDARNDAEDDGSLVDTAEQVLDPLIAPFVPDANDDDETLLDPEEAARNDADQRRN